MMDFVDIYLKENQYNNVVYRKRIVSGTFYFLGDQPPKFWRLFPGAHSMRHIASHFFFLMDVLFSQLSS